MKSTPPEGKKYGTHFAFGTSPSTPWKAHVAGPVFGTESHFDDATKPCVHYLTKGHLRCKYCDRNVTREWRGWLGVYRHLDNKPVGVVLGEGMYEIADSLYYGECVVIGKGLLKFDGAWVRREEGKAYHSSLAARMCSYDIRPNLIHLWQIPELREWYMCQPESKRLPDSKKAKANPTTLTPQEYAEKREEFLRNLPLDKRDKMRREMEEEDARRAKKEPVSGDVFKTPPQPSTNGMH